MAAFNDATANRWEQWKYHDNLGAIGRLNGTIGLDTGDIRSAADMLIVRNQLGVAFPARPNGAADQAIYDQALPLYTLLIELAGIVDDFDSDDRNGQIDTGTRRNADNDNDQNQYNNWTQQELYEVSDVAGPRAIRGTAELIRYFYSLIDDTAPDITMNFLSSDVDNPFETQGLVVPFVATASDDISGHDLDGFFFTVDRFDGQNWVFIDFVGTGLGLQSYQSPSNGLYRVAASVENGAGLTGTTAFSYFEVTVPEPSTSALALAGLCLSARRLLLISRRALTPGYWWGNRTLTRGC